MGNPDQHIRSGAHLAQRFERPDPRGGQSAQAPRSHNISRSGGGSVPRWPVAQDERNDPTPRALPTSPFMRQVGLRPVARLLTVAGQLTRLVRTGPMDLTSEDQQVPWSAQVQPGSIASSVVLKDVTRLLTVALQRPAPVELAVYQSTTRVPWPAKSTPVGGEVSHTVVIPQATTVRKSASARPELTANFTTLDTTTPQDVDVNAASNPEVHASHGNYERGKLWPRNEF